METRKASKRRKRRAVAALSKHQKNGNGRCLVSKILHERGMDTRGVRSGEDFAGLMSAIMIDVVSGNLAPQLANATCNAGGRLLRVFELAHKYGKQKDLHGKPMVLELGS